MNLADPAVSVPLAAFGLVFGSFTTALSYRLPKGQSIARGRSRCAACGHELNAFDLVPVASWLIQGGRCRYCRARISWRYPAIEIATMLLFLGSGFFIDDVAHLGLLLAMIPVMMALAVTDLEHRRVPNSLVAVLTVLALIWRWTLDRGLLQGFAMALFVFAGAILLDRLCRRVGRWQGLGMGDAKLLAVGGLALPPLLLLSFLALAGTIGVLFGLTWFWLNKAIRFPFAPAILAALWIILANADSPVSVLAIFHSGGG